MTGPSCPRRVGTVTFRAVILPALTWLALPLLLGPLLASRSRRGEAIARVVLAGFTVGALVVGAETAVPGELARYAAATPGNALFVSLTLGLLIGALGPWPWPPDRWPQVVALPVLAGAVAAMWGNGPHWSGLLLGAVLGALPLVAGRTLPGGGVVREPDLSEAAPGWWLAITAAIALAEPLVLILLLPMPWLLPGRRRGWPTPVLRRLCMPLLALAFGVALVWLAVTVAGTPWIRLGDYISAAPLSAGAERLAAVLALGMVVALAAPWPLTPIAPLLLPVPAVVLLAHRFATDLAPQGVAAWLPAVAMFLVPSAVMEAFRGRWAGALGSIAVLGGLLGNAWGLVAGLVLALVSVTPSLRRTAPVRGVDRVTFLTSPWLAAPVAGALAVVVAALLRSEVVLATLLTAGLATALARRAAPPVRTP